MIENFDKQIWVVCDITGLGEWQNTNQSTKGRDMNFSLLASFLYSQGSDRWTISDNDIDYHHQLLDHMGFLIEHGQDEFRASLRASLKRLGPNQSTKGRSEVEKKRDDIRTRVCEGLRINW